MYGTGEVYRQGMEYFTIDNGEDVLFEARFDQSCRKF